MGFLTTEERVRVRIAHLVRHGRRFSGGHAIAALATRPAPDLLDAI